MWHLWNPRWQARFPPMRPWTHRWKNSTLNGRTWPWGLSCFLPLPLAASGWRLVTLDWVAILWDPWTDTFSVDHNSGYFVPVTAASGSRNDGPWEFVKWSPRGVSSGTRGQLNWDHPSCSGKTMAVDPALTFWPFVYARVMRTYMFLRTKNHFHYSKWYSRRQVERTVLLYNSVVWTEARTTVVEIAEKKGVYLFEIHPFLPSRWLTCQL